MSSTDNSSTTSSVETDDKFVRFLVGGLGADGVHAWWIVFLFGTIAIIAIIFSFFGAVVDSNFVVTPVSNDDTRSALLYERLKSDLNMNDLELRRYAEMIKSRRELGNPFMNTERYA